MNIVVTVPHKELANVAMEEQWVVGLTASERGRVCCFWSVSRSPKRLRPGDRVYFIHDNYIVNYNIFRGCDWDCRCEVTGREWPGLSLVMEVPSIPVDPPIPMKGFRGFRYVEF